MDAPPQPFLYQRAIDAALSCLWDEAVKLNKRILKFSPQDVDALSRLARAYMELGRFNLAKKYYLQALKLDPYHPIVTKNLKMIKSFKGNGRAVMYDQTKLSPSFFLQEAGKTKIMNLLRVAEPQKLSQLVCGMKVGMVLKGRKIIVADLQGKYLGVLPDDMCHHLIRLMRGGNKYELFIKSIRVNGLSVLIRETYRSKRFKNQPSFLETSTTRTSEIITSFDGENEEGETPEESEEEQGV